MSGWVTRVVERVTGARQQAHIVQIGLDFGTAFLKGVCRDLMKDSAWVYVPSNARSHVACLVPASITVSRGEISRGNGSGSLPSVKMALRRVAMGEWDDPVLEPFASAAGTRDPRQLRRFVECCATYLIAETLAGVRRSIESRLKGFGGHPDDYAAVNMAIPVADAQLPAVNRAFLTALRAGWRLSEGLQVGQPLRIEEVQRVLTEATAESKTGDDACFVYPEVSANVQGFVRSRMSKPDIYLFCDVGAGTVDLSVFIYHQHNNVDSLTYLAACVAPLGSSQIEYRASLHSHGNDEPAIARLRELKERNAKHPALDAARESIVSELTTEAVRTLALAKRKLYNRNQLGRARIIFGGGGFCESPYGTGTCAAFASDIFPNRIKPDRLGMPKPTDLDLHDKHAAWMNRLSVAYGLSFPRQELVPFIYPVHVNTPAPEEIWQPRRGRGYAPSKDDV